MNNDSTLSRSAAVMAEAARINLSSLGSSAFYRRAAAESGLNVRTFTDLTPHLVRHYTEGL